jgi:hypothetical protein
MDLKRNGFPDALPSTNQPDPLRLTYPSPVVKQTKRGGIMIQRTRRFSSRRRRDWRKGPKRPESNTMRNLLKRKRSLAKNKGQETYVNKKTRRMPEKSTESTEEDAASR